MLRSLWFEGRERPERPALEHDIAVDVAVVGAGIVGLTTALHWDCPCHGSRFAPSGEVIEGPAVRPLGSSP